MRPLLTFLLAFFYLHTHAQAPKEKWGNPTKEELTMAYCTLDPNAGAAILDNYGHYYFNRHYYFSAQELRTIYHYQVRLKVFTDEGKKYATITIPYRGYDEYENVVEISGSTYNLEGGKMVRTKLRAKTIKWTREGTAMWYCTFTLPDVKPGSVIEYTYKIASLDFARLRDWHFQSSIPVLHSNMKLTTPYFYQFAFFSNMPQARLDVKRTELSQYIQFYTQNIYVNSVDLQLTARNIPAFRNEILMPDSSRQILKGEFLLSSAITRPIEFARFNDYYLMPYLKPLMLTTTNDLYEVKQRIMLYNELMTGYKIIEGMEWKDFTKQLSKNPDFGKNMLRAFDENKSLTDSLRRVEAGKKRMIAAYDYIRHNIKWNGQYRIFASHSMEKIFEKKTGYSSDVNMLLINTLNRVGIQARPVLIATRSHGIPYKEVGFLRKFNHLIVSVELEGKRYLLDATDPLRPYDILSDEDLNGEGLLVNLLDYQWIPLESASPSELIQKETHSISGDGKYTAATEAIFTGQLALMKIKQKKEGSGNSNIPYTMSYSRQGSLPITADSIVLMPLLENSPVENPFTEEQRTHPVDFRFERTITREVKIEIPEGYKISSLPQNRVFAMQGDFVVCSVNSQTENNAVTLTFRLELKNSYIPPQFYPDLKLFMETVKALENETVVIKKI